MLKKEFKKLNISKSMKYSEKVVPWIAEQAEYKFNLYFRLKVHITYKMTRYTSINKIKKLNTRKKKRKQIKNIKSVQLQLATHAHCLWRLLRQCLQIMEENRVELFTGLIKIEIT